MYERVNCLQGNVTLTNRLTYMFTVFNSTDNSNQLLNARELQYRLMDWFSLAEVEQLTKLIKQGYKINVKHFQFSRSILVNSK